MMFLIRTAFWLLILILLLPTDQDQQDKIYGTAQAAMNDVAGFCDRNPQTCATGHDAFEVLVHKAQYGAQMVINLVEGKTVAFGNPLPEPVTMPGPVPMPGDGSVMPVPAAAPLEPTTWDTTASQDTLNPEDREVAWGGPGV